MARNFGATGIGLCRTEHMFFEGERIVAVREMILADDEAGRRRALTKLLPIQREDFEGLFRAMNGLPVTIRLLDPPLHEFVPHNDAAQRIMAADMRVPLGKIKMRVEELAEFNPMMGHRGCRLGISYPEVTEMQTRAVLEAALNVQAHGIVVKAEIMVPLVGTVREFNAQATVIRRAAAAVFSERKESLPYQLGTMIETPRACVAADSIGAQAEFFSFGTNDLTQMTLGFSRDDAEGVVHAHEELARWLQRSSIAEIHYRQPEEQNVDAVVARMSHGTHQIGTARMGVTRSEGVVDRNLRCFDAPNLYVASSAVFTTSSQANPTLSIIAFAVRLAEHLALDARPADVRPESALAT